MSGACSPLYGGWVVLWCPPHTSIGRLVPRVLIDRDVTTVSVPVSRAERDVRAKPLGNQDETGAGMSARKYPQPRLSAGMISALVVTLVSAAAAGVTHAIMTQYVARNAFLAGDWLLTPSLYRVAVPVLWGLPVALGVATFLVTRDRRRPSSSRRVGWR